MLCGQAKSLDYVVHSYTFVHDMFLPRINRVLKAKGYMVTWEQYAQKLLVSIYLLKWHWADSLHILQSHNSHYEMFFCSNPIIRKLFWLKLQKYLFWTSSFNYALSLYPFFCFWSSYHSEFLFDDLFLIWYILFWFSVNNCSLMNLYFFQGRKQ